MTSPRSLVSTGPVRILLVEDDLDQAHLVKFLLEAGGDYVVGLVQDGDRAIERILDQDWDLVITDLNLPGADGTAVVAAARARRDDLPILATTGYTGPEYSQRAMEMGADAVLVKPLDRDELLERVRSLIEGGRPVRPARGPLAGPAPIEPERDPPLPPAPPRPAADTPGLSDPTPPPKPEVAPGSSGVQVLAIGVYPGEIECGCGGALLRHRRRGDRIVVLHLASGPPGDRSGENGRIPAREAARSFGARSFVGNAEGSRDSDGAAARKLAAGAVLEIRPDVLYLPSRHHRSRAHRAAHEAAMGAAEGRVSHVLAYDAGEIDPAFAPTLFLALGPEETEEKIRALRPYRDRFASTVDEAFVRTAARFWARFIGGEAAEPFERLAGDPPHPAFIPLDRPPNEEPA